MNEALSLVTLLKSRFGDMAVLAEQHTIDGTPTLWISRESIKKILTYLKHEVEKPYKMLYDLCGIDERKRTQRNGQPVADFTVVYHLTSFERNEDIRLKIALTGEYPSVPSITGIWPSANWYEREVYDMFGISFDGHPNLRRILMPRSWNGYPLRKEHPARATELEPFTLDDQMRQIADDDLRFKPEDFPTFESLRARWAEEEKLLMAFVEGLTDERLNERFGYTSTEGRSHERILWQTMAHLINHGTQHKTETAAMLTNFGHSPGDIDLIWYIIETQ